MIMKKDSSIHLIGRIRENANNFILKKLEAHGVVGIVPSHGDIMFILRQYDTLTMSDLSERIRRDPSTVTSLVKKLIKFGYISSTKNPDDGRSSLISLTDKGKALGPCFKEISEEMFSIEYRGISEEERKMFVDILKRVNQNFSDTL